ncbi:MAG TPA: SDR family oxidoreductase [Acidobacteriota bacterium]|nr:SDR family oxidoreductase [Acidobacteriota bacterium]
MLQSEELTDMIAQVYRTFGQIDVLINNAAVFDRKSFFELTETDWDHTLDTNLKIPFLCSRLVGEKMLGQGTGKIINLACVGGVRPWANFIPYSVSKAGLIMLTEALALALAPLIQVNAIAPGRIEFPDHAVPDVPSFPTGQPQDITRAVRYLIESDYVTGETLLVDGGRHLR